MRQECTFSAHLSILTVAFASIHLPPPKSFIFREIILNYVLLCNDWVSKSSSNPRRPQYSFLRVLFDSFSPSSLLLCSLGSPILPFCFNSCYFYFTCEIAVSGPDELFLKISRKLPDLLFVSSFIPLQFPSFCILFVITITLIRCVRPGIDFDSFLFHLSVVRRGKGPSFIPVTPSPPIPRSISIFTLYLLWY